MVENFNNFDSDDILINDYYHSIGDDRSKYHSIENFNAVFTDIENSLTLCNYNIRSFKSNFDNFEGFLQAIQNKFSIIVLTETRFADGGGMNIDCYTGHHVGRVGGAGGGVSVYSVPMLNARPVAHLSFVNENIECCTVKINANQRNIAVLAIYRPPSGRICDFADCLVGMLNDESISGCEIIITGDLNIDLTEFENLNNDSRYFVDNMFSHGFLPLITRSTRFPSGGQHGSPSILDHVWYNRCNAVWSGILIYDVTDHLPTFIVLKDVLLPNSTLVRVKFRDKSVANIERFIQVCSELNFDLSVTDVNINTKLFIETLDELYCRSFPVKVKYISCKRLSKPWLTSGLLKSIKNKSKYFKQFKLGLINETFYKSYRNSLTNAVKQAKRTYYLNSFEICKGDVKGTWRLLNDLIVREKKNRNVNSVIVDNI